MRRSQSWSCAHLLVHALLLICNLLHAHLCSEWGETTRVTAIPAESRSALVGHRALGNSTKPRHSLSFILSLSNSRYIAISAFLAPHDGLGAHEAHRGGVSRWRIAPLTLYIPTYPLLLADGRGAESQNLEKDITHGKYKTFGRAFSFPHFTHSGMKYIRWSLTSMYTLMCFFIYIWSFISFYFKQTTFNCLSLTWH